MLVLFFVLLTVLTFIVSKIIYKRILSPFSVFLGNFFFALTILHMVDFINKDFTLNAVLIILFSLIFFIIFSLVAYFIFHSNYSKNKFNDIFISHEHLKIFKILFALSIIGQIYYFVQIEMNIGLLNVLRNPNLLNLAIAYEDLNLGSIPMYLKALSIPNAMFLLLFRLKFIQNKGIVTFMLIVSILINVDVRRSSLFYLLALLLFIFIYYKRPSVNKSIELSKNIKKFILFIFLGIISVFFFVMMQSLLNKQDNQIGSFLGFELPNYLVTIIQYYAANIASFNEYIERDYSNVILFGTTLRLLYKVFTGLNIMSYDDSFLALDSVYVPYGINTTLAHFYIYIESGFIGIVLLFSLLGFITSFYFLNYGKSRNDLLLLKLSILSVMLLFSIREYVILFIDIWILIFVIYTFEIYLKVKSSKKNRS